MIVREYIRKSKTGGTRGIKSRKICKTFLHFSKTDKVLGANIDPWHDKKEKTFWNNIPAGNYMFKVSNRNTRTRCEICSKLTIKTPERR